MAPQNDPHSVLGVPKSASTDEVKAAWRRLVLELHPDRNPGGRSEDAFKKMQEAYRMLVQEPVIAEAGGRPPGWPEAGAYPRFHQPPGVSRTLQLCAMGLAAGCGIFYGAVILVTEYDMYGSKETWRTASAPTPPTIKTELLKEAVLQERARGKMLAAGGKSM